MRREEKRRCKKCGAMSERIFRLGKPHGRGNLKPWVAKPTEKDDGFCLDCGQLEATCRNARDRMRRDERVAVAADAIATFLRAAAGMEAESCRG